MKRITMLLVVLAPSILFAREYLAWSYQELYDRADVVVIAKPLKTKTTEERRTLASASVNGVLTEFKVETCMKGGTNFSSIVMHHYELGKDSVVFNGPGLIAFDTKESANSSYLLFLAKESDKQYVPVAGQTDAILSVFRLDQ
jgi:hypothetical protein